VSRHQYILLIVLLLFAQGGITHAEADKGETAKFLTYNVLADPVHKEMRLAALFKILGESDADLIALQEVAPWFLDELKKEAWLKNYHYPQSEGEPFAPRGLFILSRSPVTKITAEYLPSRQQRAYLIVETKVKGVKVSVATCHLDSFLDQGELRARQLGIIYGKLKDAESAVFLGDFNFGDMEEPETSKLDKGYTDAWEETKGDDAGFTWNIEASKMALEGSFPNEPSRRLDRILLRSERFKAIGAEVLGDKALDEDGNVFPSDHFGLGATVRVGAKEG